jgi:hypothetical protein
MSGIVLKVKQFNPNYSRIILTLLKNLAFCFNKFRKKAGFSNAGLPCSAEASRRRACIPPANLPAFKNFPAYQRDLFLNNAG